MQILLFSVLLISFSYFLRHGNKSRADSAQHFGKTLTEGLLLRPLTSMENLPLTDFSGLWIKPKGPPLNHTLLLALSNSPLYHRALQATAMERLSCTGNKAMNGNASKHSKVRNCFEVTPGTWPQLKRFLMIP